MKRTLVAMLAGGLLAVAPAAGLAASNPAGTGQPGAECGEEGATMEPAGFLTTGFQHAETVYAGMTARHRLRTGAPMRSPNTTSPATR